MTTTFWDRRLLAIWLLLTAAGCATWLLAADHGLIGGRQAAGIAALAIALIKVRLIGLDFMELRHAPTWLRAAYEGYWLTLVILIATVDLVT